MNLTDSHDPHDPNDIEAIRRFALTFFRSRNCEVQEQGDHLLVHASSEVVRLLEEPWSYLWQALSHGEAPPRTHRFRTRRDTQETDEESELLAPGGRAFERLLDAALGQGKVTRGYALVSSQQVNEQIMALRRRATRRQPKRYLVDWKVVQKPFLIVTWLVTFICGSSKAQDRRNAIDLENGEILEDATALLQLPVVETSLESSTIPAALPLQEAVERLMGEVRQDSQPDPQWLAAGKARYEAALQRMERYFLELGVTADDPEYVRRCEELRWREAPRVEIAPDTAALLYVPYLQVRFLQTSMCEEIIEDRYPLF
ncbi:MAG: hypothetical protein IMW91_02675 [Firmicutes bacterium]|nr:hypothetical protein [Bacillota bacterium]